MRGLGEIVRSWTVSGIPFDAHRPSPRHCMNSDRRATPVDRTPVHYVLVLNGVGSATYVLCSWQFRNFCLLLQPQAPRRASRAKIMPMTAAAAA